MELFAVNEFVNDAGNWLDNDIAFKIFIFKRGRISINKRNKNSQIVFLLEGNIEVSCNDYHNVIINKDEIFFISQASEISFKALSDGKFMMLTFDIHKVDIFDKYALQTYADVSDEIESKFRSLPIREPINSFLSSMEYYIQNNIYCSNIHEIKQRELFLLMRKVYSKSEMINLLYPIIGRSLVFRSIIMENYLKVQTVDELAKIVGMSTSHFARSFRIEFGESVYQWLQKQKAKHIKYKLLFSTCSISDIILEFKFSTPSHFTRFCKKYYGCPPSTLIKRERGKSDKLSIFQ